MESYVPGLAQVMKKGAWGSGNARTPKNTEDQWCKHRASEFWCQEDFRLKAKLFHLISYLTLGNLPHFDELFSFYFCLNL